VKCGGDVEEFKVKAEFPLTHLKHHEFVSG
jgi:hypothetical protein